MSNAHMEASNVTKFHKSYSLEPKVYDLKLIILWAGKTCMQLTAVCRIEYGYEYILTWLRKNAFLHHAWFLTRTQNEETHSWGPNILILIIFFVFFFTLSLIYRLYSCNPLPLLKVSSLLWSQLKGKSPQSNTWLSISLSPLSLLPTPALFPLSIPLSLSRP